MKSVDGSVFEMVSRSSSFFKDLKKVECHVIPLRASDGIVAFLKRMADGHPHEKAIISVAGSAQSRDSCYHPKNAADVRTDSYFHSANDVNQFITYDFKDMRVLVTHSLLRSDVYQVNTHNVRSWVIEASDDGNEWMEIDRREDNDGVNGPGKSCAFEVQSVVEARFIRIRQIGPNANGHRFLILRAFELFGGLRIENSLILN
jgi:hypothetical protein